MATALNQFLAAATADTIRCNNQYEVTCTSGITEVDNVLQTAVMFGNNFTIPERGVDYATVYYKGYEMVNLVPTRLTMGNTHTMTIKCDTNGEYRRAFLAWMGAVIDPDIEGGSVFAGDRGVQEKSIIRLYLFDKGNEKVNEVYKFYNVRVTSVGAVSLTYDGGDVATFDVEFKSTYWTIEQATDGSLLDVK